ncbi:hypothetical protein GIB67_033074 [Kingdonia uniflora]|uniref:BHLH domain-containing protein n=1 Tax=Kingdonia uniflora TaxID=39325 RepID=A0A7J7MYX4_9MAGN|nr:hypothetical protein GIB67_033074 [Kingdonia uniflora]
MSSGRRSRGSRITENEINDLISKLQAHIPEIRRRGSTRGSASSILKETCNHIRSLQREVEDLSERLSEVLSTLDTTSAEAEAERSGVTAWQPNNGSLVDNLVSCEAFYPVGFDNLMATVEPLYVDEIERPDWVQEQPENVRKQTRYEAEQREQRVRCQWEALVLGEKMQGTHLIVRVK